MNWRAQITAPRLAAAGLALAVLLSLAPVRHLMEASMARHMLLQFPLLMLSGALMASALTARTRRALAGWNEHGISGLVFVGLTLAVAMVPRLLDLALVNGAIELAKCAVLLLAGAALRLSWQPAGLLVQGFFLGNVLPMSVVVGQLYVNSPVRVCNAYLLGDQVRLGQALTWVSAIVAAIWLAQVAWVLIRRDQAMLAADEAR